MQITIDDIYVVLLLLLVLFFVVCILFLSRRNDLEIQGKANRKKKKMDCNRCFLVDWCFRLCSMFVRKDRSFIYQKRNNLVDAFIASIGKNTFGIYLSHCIFIFTLQRFWTYSGFVERLIAFCIVFASSYVFTVIINRIPGLCKIVQI